MVPTWVFERQENQDAIFRGMAAILEKAAADIEQHVTETFIDQGSDEYVELQGEERSVPRLPGEALSVYRSRVKRIVNKSNLPAIKALVDSLLIRGTSTIIEHSDQSGAFLNRGFYLNRNVLEFDVLYNAFTILIDYQIPSATSFYNRGTFLNRTFLNGSSISSDTVFKNIIQAVNKDKAFGTVYRLIERANP